MKTRWICGVMAVLGMLCGARPAQTLAETAPPPWLLEKVDPAPDMRLIWQTDPGVRYDLWTSTDLVNWAHPDGFPAVATGLAQDFEFTAGDRGFFRFYPIDEQPPVVADQFPAAEGFAVGRFAKISVALEDASDIDPASIQLTIPGLGFFTLADPRLTFANGVVTFDTGGDLALGAYGATITATLTAADVNGYALSHTWSFRLELQPEAAANVFVFGSPTAQRAGQRLNGPAATLAARFATGPVKMNAAADPWSIVSLTADTIVLSYTPGNPPAFTAGQLICNLAPASRDEIFYRRILAVENDAASSQLILTTEEAVLTDFIESGSARLSDDTVLLEFGPTGSLAKSFSGSERLGRDIAIDLAGPSIGVSELVPPHREFVRLTFDELFWRWKNPEIDASLEFERFFVPKWRAIVSGDFEQGCVIDATVKIPFRDEAVIPSLQVPRISLYDGLIPVGGVPIYVSVGLKVDVVGFYELSAVGTYHYGSHETGFLRMGAKGRGITLDFIKESSVTSKTPVPFTFDGASAVNVVGIKLKPTVDVVFAKAVGVSLFGSAELFLKSTLDTTGALNVYLGQSYTWGIQPAGPVMDALNITSKLEFPIWSSPLLKLWPAGPPISFSSQPDNQTVPPGAFVTFTAGVESFYPPSMQWFHNALPIPGQTSRTLFLPRVNAGHAGNYYVRATAGGQSVNSDTATLTVQAVTSENRDSDGDGLPDAVETNTGTWVSSTNTGTDPLKWDTDGDGLADGVETRTFTYVSRSNTGTDPNLFDTDADGVGDKAEIDAGTNPLLGVAPYPTPRRIATGAAHSLFIKSDETLWGMGWNFAGQLGDGTTTSRPSPIQIATGVTQVAAGYEQSLFIKSDGTLWGMGSNSDGQLGDGTITTRLNPVQVATGVAQVAAGVTHSLFIKSDGTLWSMGDNRGGQLGDGTTTSQLSPVLIATGVAHVAGGGGYSLFIKSDGTLWGVGSNSGGQLGDGTTTDRLNPVQVATDVAEVAAGWGNSLFIKSDGTLWGMGVNNHGELGDGTTTTRVNPVQIATGVAQAAAGPVHSLFIKNDGTLWGMGYNHTGELGDGTTTTRLSPVQIATSVAQVVTGGFLWDDFIDYSLFITIDSVLWGMGENRGGQLGDGTTETRLSPVQISNGL